MQNLKPRFRSQDGGTLATRQSCIRTNDIDLVGDGTHLTYFEMLGNFSFRGAPYEHSVELWKSVLADLKLTVNIHVHPDGNHHHLWKGYQVVDDPECVWSDGNVGGYCCEVYHNGIEIGNLVNPMEHSTDVGFGWERLVMVYEGKDRVDETSLFNTNHPFVIRDHVRTLDALWDNGVPPGSKGRNSVCRKLIRRLLPYYHVKWKWSEWLEAEWKVREKSMKTAQKLWRRHKDKSPEWWWETCGVTEEDLKVLR